MTGNRNRFRPAGDLLRMDPLRGFEEMMKDFMGMPAFGGDPEARIRMDLTETDQAYIVKADVPGVKKEDIRISIEGGQVSIQAETREEKNEQQGGHTMRSERYVGQLYRSFSLPQEIDDARAEARCENGVLTLILPKKTGGTGRQIPVQ